MPVRPSATVPARVRAEAFRAATIAPQDYLRGAGYHVDAIAELEVIEAQLRRVVATWDAATAAPVH